MYASLAPQVDEGQCFLVGATKSFEMEVEVMGRGGGGKGGARRQARAKPQTLKWNGVFGEEAANIARQGQVRKSTKFTHN